MVRLALVLVVPITSAACGGGQPAAHEPTPDNPRAEARASCELVFARQRDCTEVFIPALVSWRVELDAPAGIAARDQADGRDALVAKAMEEWQADSSDERIAATCDGIVESIPDDRLASLMELGDACLAEPSCQGFVDCVEPAQRQRLSGS
jgi:hypothetical protein